jgi:hypothetical protein
MEFKIGNKLDRVSEQNNILITIFLLHINGFINNDSLNSLLKQARKGTLSRRVNTYKSNINNRWYNDEKTVDIYEDVFESKLKPRTPQEKLKFERVNKLRKLNGLPPKVFKTHLNFDDMMKYLNLYLNKNKNFCIDHLFYEYIKPYIKTFEWTGHILRDMFNYDFSHLEVSRDRSSYWDRWDDDDYDDYYESEWRNKQTQEKVTKEISDFLNTKRTHRLAYKELK